MAQLGWQTSDEIRALRDFSYDPEIVVLSYCLNDIFGVGGSETAVARRELRSSWWLAAGQHVPNRRDFYDE